MVIRKVREKKVKLDKKDDDDDDDDDFDNEKTEGKSSSGKNLYETPQSKMYKNQNKMEKT